MLVDHNLDLQALCDGHCANIGDGDVKALCDHQCNLIKDRAIAKQCH